MSRILIGAGMMMLCAAASAQQAPTTDELLTQAPAKNRTKVGVAADVSILLGIGISAAIPLPKNFSARASYHTYSYDDEFEDDNATYNAELRLRSFAALADWFPFNGAFRVTGGLMSNGNEIRLAGKDNGNGEYEVGDCTYESNPADPLNINGVIDFKSSAPYLGVGWGGNMNAKPGFYGVFDLGVMFSGAPGVVLGASGSARAKAGSDSKCGSQVTYTDVASFSQFQDAKAQAEQDAEDEAQDFKLWPNISFGMGWRF